MSRRLLCLAILGVLCLSQACCIAHAQTPEDQEVVPLYDLKSALPFVNWDSKAHGPLIAIQPDKILWIPPTTPVEINSDFDPATFDTSMLPLYPPKDRYGYNADFIARYYDRKLIHYPTLTIFAPTEILRLNTERLSVSIRETVTANPEGKQTPPNGGIVLDFTTLHISDIPTFLTGAMLPVGAH